MACRCRSLARSARLLSLERAGERTLLLRLVGRSGVHEHLTEDAIQKPAARTDRDLRHELAGVGERGFEHLRVLLEEVRKRLQRPEVVVEHVLAGLEDRKLGTALTAVLQERLGIEHLEAEVGRKRVGECLTGTQRNAVLGRQKAEFAVADNRLLL